jgi:hypothetical protein
MNKYNLTLMVTSCLTASLVCGVAGAEIERSSYSTHDGEYVKVLVSDDNWQPEPFDQGIIIPATFVQTESIVLDGVDNEVEWLAAEEITVPLSYGAIKSLQIKALYTDEDALLRVRWRDDSENREYHPWIWNEEKGNYETGPQVDDALIFNFEAGCDWFPSLLSGYEFDFDGWYWTAGRSDQEGLAIDIYGSMKRKTTSKDEIGYTVRNKESEWNLKFSDVPDGIIDPETVYNTWDQSDRKYEIWPVQSDTMYFLYLVDEHRVSGRPSSEFSKPLPPPERLPSTPADIQPQFALTDLTDNAKDVRAKGHWQDGYWTVEFRRTRLTEAGLAYDFQFERLTQFSLHVFDGVERLDQSSESPRLFLQFLEKNPSKEPEKDLQVASE